MREIMRAITVGAFAIMVVLALFSSISGCASIGTRDNIEESMPTAEQIKTWILVNTMEWPSEICYIYVNPNATSKYSVGYVLYRHGELVQYAFLDKGKARGSLLDSGGDYVEYFGPKPCLEEGLKSYLPKGENL